MTSVEKISVASVNFSGKNNRSHDVETTDLKKRVIPANIALGSLATLAVLGMADILLCKGKLNKLTSKGKELEEALERVASAEARAAAAETKATGLETALNKLQEQYDKTTKYVDRIKELSGEERLSDVVHGGLIQAPLYNTGHGRGILRDFVQLYENFLMDESMSVKEREFMAKWVKKKLEKNGCELVEKFDPEMISDFEVHYTGKGDVPVVTAPILRVIDSGKVLQRGTVVMPRKA
jgi:predicted nuclease with TOPRIM domain